MKVTYQRKKWRSK
ncbi:outer membrane protein, partial [Yersinia pestis PY-06]